MWTRRDGARRGHSVRNRPCRTGGVAGASSGASLRAAEPAKPVRFVSCADREDIRRGRIATFPTGPASTWPTASRRRWSGSRPGSGNWCLREASGLPRRWRNTTLTTWEGISTAVFRTWGSFSLVQRGCSVPTQCHPPTCTSAHRRRRPGAGSTGCADISPPKQPFDV